MPNVHKAILKLLLDWVNMCPRDFKQGQLRRELIDFLNRVSLMGDQYRWLVEEIRLQAGIDVRLVEHCNYNFLTLFICV